LGECQKGQSASPHKAYIELYIHIKELWKAGTWSGGGSEKHVHLFRYYGPFKMAFIVMHMPLLFN